MARVLDRVVCTPLSLKPTMPNLFNPLPCLLLKNRSKKSHIIKLNTHIAIIHTTTICPAVCQYKYNIILYKYVYVCSLRSNWSSKFYLLTLCLMTTCSLGKFNKILFTLVDVFTFLLHTHNICTIKDVI